MDEPLDDFTFGDALANVSELEGVEDLAGGEEGVCGVEVCAEDRTTNESALYSNVQHRREREDPARII